MLTVPTAGGADEGKGKKWELSRPKDIKANVFSGKEDDWARWKENLEDYADAVHTGLKHAHITSAKFTETITEKAPNQPGRPHRRKMAKGARDLYSTQEENRTTIRGKKDSNVCN